MAAPHSSRTAARPPTALPICPPSASTQAPTRGLEAGQVAVQVEGHVIQLGLLSGAVHKRVARLRQVVCGGGEGDGSRGGRNAVECSHSARLFPVLCFAHACKHQALTSPKSCSRSVCLPRLAGPRGAPATAAGDDMAPTDGRSVGRSAAEACVGGLERLTGGRPDPAVPRIGGWGCLERAGARTRAPPSGGVAPAALLHAWRCPDDCQVPPAVEQRQRARVASRGNAEEGWRLSSNKTNAAGSSRLCFLSCTPLRLVSANSSKQQALPATPRLLSPHSPPSRPLRQPRRCTTSSSRQARLHHQPSRPRRRLHAPHQTKWRRRQRRR